MTYVNEGSVFAIGVLFIVLGIATVSARFAIRYQKNQGIGIDDWLCVSALVFVVADGAICIAGAATHTLGGHSPDDLTISESEEFTGWQQILAEKLQVPFSIIAILALTLLKLSVLFFYRRIFKQRAFKIANWSLIIFVICWGIAFEIDYLAECGDHFMVRVSSLENFSDNCSGSFVASVFMTVFDVITDIALVILPIPFIWKLQMPRSRKIASICILFVGMLTIAISVSRLAIYIEIYAPTGTMSLIIFWTMLELGVAIITVCLPTLRPLFAHFVPARFLLFSADGIYGTHSRSRSRSRSHVSRPSLSASTPNVGVASATTSSPATAKLNGSGGYGRGGNSNSSNSNGSRPQLGAQWDSYCSFDIEGTAMGRVSGETVFGMGYYGYGGAGGGHSYSYGGEKGGEQQQQQQQQQQAGQTQPSFVSMDELVAWKQGSATGDGVDRGDMMAAKLSPLPSPPSSLSSGGSSLSVVTLGSLSAVEGSSRVGFMRSSSTAAAAAAGLRSTRNDSGGSSAIAEEEEDEEGEKKREEKEKGEIDQGKGEGKDGVLKTEEMQPRRKSSGMSSATVVGTP